MRGAVSGTVLAPPFSNIARQAGYRELADLRKTDIEYAGNSIAANIPYIKSHPQLVENFLKGYVESLYFFQDAKRTNHRGHHEVSQNQRSRARRGRLRLLLRLNAGDPLCQRVGHTHVCCKIWRRASRKRQRPTRKNSTIIVFSKRSRIAGLPSRSAIRAVRSRRKSCAATSSWTNSHEKIFCSRTSAYCDSHDIACDAQAQGLKKIIWGRLRFPLLNGSLGSPKMPRSTRKMGSMSNCLSCGAVRVRHFESPGRREHLCRAGDDGDGHDCESRRRGPHQHRAYGQSGVRANSWQDRRSKRPEDHQR